MDLIIGDLRVPVENDGAEEYLKIASEKLKTGLDDITLLKILAKSLDTSDKEQFYWVLTVVVRLPETFQNKNNLLPYIENRIKESRPAALKERPVVVGFGPAGMFAALELISRGIEPVVFEQGKRIDERSLDIAKFFSERTLDTDSNIQFGEGGAGSYSDGKLFSRMSGNTDYMNKVMDTFIKFGAPEEIRYINKPHLGTDVLCGIVKNIREYILSRGEIFYSSKVTDIIVSEGKALGVVVNGQREYLASKIYLAPGHSSRDMFELLENKGVAMERKPVSIGLRIEHPAEVIGLMRYGEKYKKFPAIGPAFYSFTHNSKISRNVCSFCMCPGGEVLNASSENGMLVTNGMSYSKRSSKFSNSALIAGCRTDDYSSAGPLAGVAFQREIEHKAFKAGGSGWKVPAQNLNDFLSGKVSSRLNESSCRTGTSQADLNAILPGFVSGALREALGAWKKDYPLFVSEHAVLLGAETRAVCPVRIKRRDNFESENTDNLYPVGEGSGYAGGITSSAIDAIKAVEASLAAAK